MGMLGWLRVGHVALTGREWDVFVVPRGARCSIQFCRKNGSFRNDDKE